MASRGVNKVILVGNVGKDPEIRFSQSGEAVTKVTIATSEEWKDKNGEKQSRVEWHRVVFFGRLAEIVGEYVTKGKQIYVEGQLRTTKYTDKAGVEKYSTEIIASEMQLLGSKGGEGGEGGQRAPTRQPADRAPAAEGRSTRGGGDGFSTVPAREPAPQAATDEDPFGDDVPF